VLLGGLVFLLGRLNEGLAFLPPFSTVTMLVVAVAPLAELYYLWQRPLQLRYPILLSISLLSFHGTLGVNYWLLGHDLGSVQLMGTMRLDHLINLMIAMGAAMVLTIYWLRSLHKRPRRGIDWAKLAAASLLFGTIPVDYLLRTYFASLIPPHAPTRIWFGLLLLGSAGLFLLFHLLDEMVLPAPPTEDPYESLIEGIQAENQAYGEADT
jgi:hypothetical protein